VLPRFLSLAPSHTHSTFSFFGSLAHSLTLSSLFSPTLLSLSPSFPFYRAARVRALTIGRCAGQTASQCRAEVLRSGGIGALVIMIDGGDADAKGAASLALAKACIDGKASAQQAFEHDAIRLLINVVNCGPELIRAHVCEALMQICWNHPPACPAAFECNGISSLVTCVRNGLGSTQRQVLYI